MKISDIVKFVLEHRKGKVCKDWSPYQITHNINEAVKDHALAFTLHDGKLSGVVWGAVDPYRKKLHIDCILTIHKDSLHKLMAHFTKYFQGYQLTADRRERFVSYNVDKLKRKLA